LFNNNKKRSAVAASNHHLWTLTATPTRLQPAGSNRWIAPFLIAPKQTTLPTILQPYWAKQAL